MIALAVHPQTPSRAIRNVSASVERAADGALTVRYVLAGEIAALDVPKPALPRAADDLWRHTCCEIFIAARGADAYHEFNFSPSGEWAAYAFKRYRERAAPLASRDPRITVRRFPERLELDATVPLAMTGPLLVGLCAVIEEAGGPLSYWALRHPAAKPDFHLRDAFSLELDEARH